MVNVGFILLQTDRGGALFSIFLICVIFALAYGIGCLGRTRKIGFTWSFIISLIFNPIIGLIVVLCSKKIEIEFVEVKKENWDKWAGEGNEKYMDNVDSEDTPNTRLKTAAERTSDNDVFIQEATLRMDLKVKNDNEKNEYIRGLYKWKYIILVVVILFLLLLIVVYFNSYNKVSSYQNYDIVHKRYGGSWNIKDSKGNLMFNEDFDYEPEFICNVGRVCVKGKKGVVDLSGEWLIPAEYESIDAINFQGEYICFHSSQRIYDLEYMVCDIDSMYFIFKKNSKYEVAKGLNKGGVLYDYEEFKPIEMNTRIPCVYFKYRKNNKYGIVDINNKIVIPNVYDDIGKIYDNNYIEAYKDGDMGIIDFDGNVLVAFKYSSVEDYFDGFILVNSQPLEDRDVLGCSSKHEKIYIKFLYNLLDQSFVFNGYRSDSKNWYFSDGSDLYFPVLDRNSVDEQFLIDRYGSVIVSKDLLVEFEGCYKGLFIVKAYNYRINLGYRMSERYANNFIINLKYGVLDKKGEWAIPPVFDKMTSFVDGKSLVKYENEEFYIDMRGSVIGGSVSPKWIEYYRLNDLFYRPRTKIEKISYVVPYMFFSDDSICEYFPGGTTVNMIYYRNVSKSIEIAISTSDNIPSELKNETIVDMMSNHKNYICQNKLMDRLSKSNSNSYIEDYGLKMLSENQSLWIKWVNRKDVNGYENGRFIYETYYVYKHPLIYSITIRYLDNYANGMIVRLFLDSIEFK